MRRNACLVGAALLVSLSTVGNRAWAQNGCQPRDALSTCVPADNLWAHAGPGPWQHLAPTATAAPSTVATGLTLSYVYRPIGLTIASPDPDGTTVFVVEHALTGTFVSALGVTDRLQVQIAAPVTLFQDGASTSDVLGSSRPLARSAVGDFRFGTAFAAITRKPGEQGFALTPRLEFAAPSGSDDAFVGSASMTFAPGIAGSWQGERVGVGVDIGARIREESQLSTALIGSQIKTAIGVSVAAIDDGWLTVTGEAYALVGLIEQLEQVTEPGDLTPNFVATGQPHVPAEWLVSARHERLMGGRLHVALAGGGTIPTGESAATAPALRAMASMQVMWDAPWADDEDEDDAPAPAP